MAIKWRYFIGAVVLLQFLPLQAMPWYSMVGGVAAAGAVNFWYHHKQAKLSRAKR
jgi:hypothetical protein